MTDGTVGRIYFLVERASGQRLAAKVLRPDWVASPSHYRRFEAEARLALSIPQHPFIVQSFHFDVYKERPRLFQEFVAGWTLQEWSELSRAAAPLPGAPGWPDWWASWRAGKGATFHPAPLLFFASEVCHALDFLYSQKIRAHGDLHGRNIMVRQESPPSIVLIDLGLSGADDLSVNDVVTLARTAFGETDGSLPYLSPEVLSGHSKLSVATDIYALGVTLHMALFGCSPYWPEARQQSARSDPGISETYRRLISRMISVAPNDRLSSIEELNKAIQFVLDQDYRLVIHVKSHRETPQESLAEKIRVVNEAASLANMAERAADPSGLRSKALRLLDGVLTADPCEPHALQIKADLLCDMHRFAEALPMIDRAETFAPDSWFVKNTKGRALCGTGDLAGGRRYFLAAIAVAEDAEQGRVSSWNLRVDAKATDGGEGTVLDEPASVQLKRRLNTAFDKQDDGDLQGAEAICRDVLRVQPTLVGAWALLGQVTLGLGRPDEAEAAYLQGLLLVPDDPTMLLGVAYSMAQQGESKAAILRMLDRIPLGGLNDAAISALRAACLSGDERTKMAKLALEIAPNHPIATKILKLPPPEPETPLVVLEFMLPPALTGLPINVVSHLKKLWEIVDQVKQGRVPLTRAMLKRVTADFELSALRFVAMEFGSAMKLDPDPAVREFALDLLVLAGQLGPPSEEP
jgi:serine/threonine protein kinase